MLLAIVIYGRALIPPAASILAISQYPSLSMFLATTSLPSPVPLSFKILFLSSLYAVMFGPFAVWAARNGEFTKLRWWFLLPIWPLLYLSIHPILVAKSFLQKIKFISLKVVVAGFLFIVPLVMLFGAILVIFQFWTGFVASHYPVLFTIGNIAITSIGGLSFAVASGWLIFRWLHDWLRWQKWFRNHRQMTCREICEAVSGYRHSSFYTRVLKVVQEKHLLAPTKDVELFLTGIVVEIEARESLKATGKVAETKKEFGLNLSHSTSDSGTSECIGLVLRADPEVLDEINMLLEDTRSAMQGIEGMNNILLNQER